MTKEGVMVGSTSGIKLLDSWWTGTRRKNEKRRRDRRRKRSRRKSCKQEQHLLGHVDYNPTSIQRNYTFFLLPSPPSGATYGQAKHTDLCRCLDTNWKYSSMNPFMS